jgi:hypothetical protein
MSTVLSYQDFIRLSYNLDRQTHYLPKESKDVINNIKKKLNISTNQDFQRVKTEKTKINKNNDELGVLYMNLNKISVKTYDKLSKEILDIIKHIDLLDEETQNKICVKFFDIISTNDYYCHLYSKLFSEITILSPLFKMTFDIKMNEYLQGFENIVYVSPNVDYDKYCDYVKSINKIKNFTMFLLKCFDENVCSIDSIVNICIGFQKIVIDQYDDDTKLIENEIYIENIHIMVKECIDVMYFNDNWEFIKRNIQYLKEEKGKGKNNKIRFKLMDIEDVIKKME